jgi:hypothetical protein
VSNVTSTTAMKLENKSDCKKDHFKTINYGGFITKKSSSACSNMALLTVSLVLFTACLLTSAIHHDDHSIHSGLNREQKFKKKCTK